MGGDLNIQRHGSSGAFRDDHDSGNGATLRLIRRKPQAVWVIGFSGKGGGRKYRKAPG